MKPTNPYKKGSTIWKVMEGDWEDLTVRQITEVLGVTYGRIGTCIASIKRKTGYDIPHISEWEGKNGHCIYTVYDNRTDLPVIVDGEARDCAKAMGITVDTFYTYVDRRKKGKAPKRWYIEKMYIGTATPE